MIDDAIKAAQMMALGVSEEEFKKLMEEHSENEHQRISRLARNIEDCVTAIHGKVARVEGAYLRTSVPTGSLHYGGPPTPMADTGASMKSIITLSKNPYRVDKIKMCGWPPLQAGDHITAYIVTGMKERVPIDVPDPESIPHVQTEAIYHGNCIPETSHFFWNKRNLTPEETAYKIEKVKGRSVLACYRDTDLMRAYGLKE